MNLITGDPYHLSMKEISELTPMQLFNLYHAERTKEGAVKPLEYPFDTESDKMKKYKIQYYAMAKHMGKTKEEIDSMWSVIENGRKKTD